MKASMQFTPCGKNHGIELSVSNFLLSFLCNVLSRKLTDLAAAYRMPLKKRRSDETWQESQTFKAVITNKEILGLGS